MTSFSLRLCGSTAFVFSCNLPFVSCNYSSGSAQIAQRRTRGSLPPDLRHFGGISRTNRQSIVPIQRLAPLNPPDNSADEYANCAQTAKFANLAQ